MFSIFALNLLYLIDLNIHYIYKFYYIWFQLNEEESSNYNSYSFRDFEISSCSNNLRQPEYRLLMIVFTLKNLSHLALPKDSTATYRVSFQNRAYKPLVMICTGLLGRTGAKYCSNCTWCSFSVISFRVNLMSEAWKNCNCVQ